MPQGSNLTTGQHENLKTWKLWRGIWDTRHGILWHMNIQNKSHCHLKFMLSQLPAPTTILPFSVPQTYICCVKTNQTQWKCVFHPGDRHMRLSLKTGKSLSVPVVWCDWSPLPIAKKRKSSLWENNKNWKIKDPSLLFQIRRIESPLSSSKLEEGIALSPLPN